MAIGLVSGVSPADITGAVSAPGVASKLLSATGATPFGWVSLGASLLSGSSINKSGAFAQTESGTAWFQAQNSGGIKKPILALDNPASVLVAAGLVVAAVYVIKRLRGK